MPTFCGKPIALSFGADKLPEEFRLFARGWNASEKGLVLFDDAAAKAVMDAYAAWGVDIAIDLEHGMLDGPTSDPTSRDARGWCRLEVRDGELWAVGVKWTADGAARLTEKRQRYVSPAFFRDPKTKRVTKIVNVAITAVPATHGTPALVAASMGANGMNPEQVTAALDALIAGDAEKCAEILKEAIAAAAGAAAPPEAPPAPEAPMVEETAAPPVDPMKEEDEKVEAVAASALVRLSGKATFTDALAEVKAWRASHLELETERQKLAAERATLEAAERRAGCAKLVKLGLAPSAVWADDKATAPKRYLAAMPIEDFREFVNDQAKAAPKGAPLKAPPTAAPPAGEKTFTTAHGTVTLSASELATCEETGAKPEVFAANKAIREAQRSRGGK